ncbi:MAG: hypothetical protein Q6353_019810 [Candidatus Sigynarchaeum springense]
MFDDHITQLEGPIKPGLFQEIVRSLNDRIHSPANADWIVRTLSKQLEAYLKGKLEQVKQEFNTQLMRIDDMIEEKLLVDAEAGIREARSLADYFSISGKEHEKKDLETAIEGRARLVESLRAEIAAQLKKTLDLQPRPSNIEENVKWIPAVKDAMEMATRAGIPVLAEQARALYQDALQDTREYLTSELTKVKAQFIKDPSDAVYQHTKSILEKIQGFSDPLYLLTIKQEASKWLSNLVLVKSILKAVRERDGISIKELRERTTMDRKTFAGFLLEWAGILGLRIAQDEVREEKEKEDLNSIIRRLDEMFRSWAEKEKIDATGKI